MFDFVFYSNIGNRVCRGNNLRGFSGLPAVGGGCQRLLQYNKYTDNYISI